jgi:mannosylfructose-6-phosphate phosphatase
VTETRLLGVGIEAVAVYSSQRDLDVLPRQADKGKCLAWLTQHLGISARTILVVGHILVENARPALLKAAGSDTYTATGIPAESVMDGLRDWGVINPRPAPPRLPAAAAGIAPDPCFPHGATEP